MKGGIKFSFPIVCWINSWHFNMKELNLIAETCNVFLVLLSLRGLGTSLFVVINIDIAGLVLYSTVLL